MQTLRLINYLNEREFVGGSRSFNHLVLQYPIQNQSLYLVCNNF